MSGAALQGDWGDMPGANVKMGARLRHYKIATGKGKRLGCPKKELLELFLKICLSDLRLILSSWICQFNQNV